VEASSVFDAAAQATHGWAELWWYEPDAVIEVRVGDQLWKIRGGRVAGVEDRQGTTENGLVRRFARISVFRFSVKWRGEALHR
jgi:hypothetical protein